MQFLQLLSNFIRKSCMHTGKARVSSQLGIFYSLVCYQDFTGKRMAQGEIQCMSLDITNSGKVRSYSTVGTSFPLFPDTLSLDREAINRESEAPSLLPATIKWISPLRKWQIVQTCNFQNEDLSSPTRRLLLCKTWSKYLKVNKNQNIKCMQMSLITQVKRNIKLIFPFFSIASYLSKSFVFFKFRNYYII